MKNLENLKATWDSYNQRLDNLETLNSEILFKIISKQQTSVLNSMKRKSLLGLLLAPFIFFLVIFPFAIEGNFNKIQIIGILLSSLVFTYYAVHSFKYLHLLNRINIEKDTLIENKQKILDIKKFVIEFHKKRVFSVPLLMIGITLVIEFMIPFNFYIKILILLFFIIGLFFWGKYKAKLSFYNRIAEIENGLKEINEYKR